MSGAQPVGLDRTDALPSAPCESWLSRADLTIGRFRHQAIAELRETGETLSGWLPAALRVDRHVTDMRPYTQQGRLFVDFYDTLYHVLKWYKSDKLAVFKQPGWHLDDQVVQDVQRQLAGLIRQALSTPGKSQFHEWFRQYDTRALARYTAVDARFQRLTGSSIRSVLDFGSGIGRQAFHWCADGRVRFFSIDAIESLYLLQNRIYRILYPERFIEYFDDPTSFGVAANAPDEGLIYHLPTWWLSGLPAGSIDLIICVQILQEISEEVLAYVLGQFRRVVRLGGLLYIRDKEFWTPSHRVRVGRELLRQGWQLVFRFTGDEGTEIEGVPRLWVYTGTDTRGQFRLLRRLKRVFLPSYNLSYGSWRDLGLPI